MEWINIKDKEPEINSRVLLYHRSDWGCVEGVYNGGYIFKLPDYSRVVSEYWMPLIDEPNYSLKQ